MAAPSPHARRLESNTSVVAIAISTTPIHRIDDSLNRLARGSDTWDLDIVLRPRDKKPLPVRINIERDNETDLLVWRISRAGESVPAATA